MLHLERTPLARLVGPLALCAACAVDTGGLAGEGSDSSEAVIAPTGVPMPGAGAPDASRETRDAGLLTRSEGGLVAPSTGTLVLTSAELVDNGAMPLELLCSEPPSSPSFRWSGGPTGSVASYALAMVTRSGGLFPSVSYSWAVWDMPADARSLSAGAGQGTVALEHVGAKQAKETSLLSWGALGFEACTGTPQTYEFRLYALSVATLPKGVGDPTPQGVVQWIESNGAVVERSQLTAHSP